MHTSGHVFWWRTYDGLDYAITVSQRGTIRFTNLHTRELKKNASIRLELRVVVSAHFVDDHNGSKVREALPRPPLCSPDLSWISLSLILFL